MKPFSTYTVFAVLAACLSNLLLPGAGLVLVGQIRKALLWLGLLICTLAIFSLTRFIASAEGLKALVLVLALLWLSSQVTLFIYTFKLHLTGFPYRYLQSLGCGLAFYGILFIFFYFRSFLMGIDLFLVPSTSMEPTILASDIIFIDTRISNFKKNDIVVFKHPTLTNSFMVKRIKNLTFENNYFMVGDNKKNSLDSSIFGTIMKEQIKGKSYASIRTWRIVNIK